MENKCQGPKGKHFTIFCTLDHSSNLCIKYSVVVLNIPFWQFATSPLVVADYLSNLGVLFNWDILAFSDNCEGL